MRYPNAIKLRPAIGIRFGSRIKELRIAHGYLQRDMAAKFGVDRSYISDLERGRKSISLPMIEVMALGFDIPIMELFRDL